MDVRPLEIYIHIPFCVRKCNYCDFLSFACTEDTKEEYVNALLTELRERSAETTGYNVVSVFFGGGTPSLLKGSQIQRIMDCIRENMNLDEKAEITMEMNPGTVDFESLLAYRKAGCNRVSFGLQSCDAKELQFLGRIHDYSAFLNGYECARKVGFDNINVDIISGLPGQKKEIYAETLRKVLLLKPEHISAYSLIVEEGTPLYDMVEKGEVEPIEEEEDRALYELTEEMLSAEGYERYEISNYAKPNMECKHNIGYWNRTDYLGFGIGAASLMKGYRFQNGSDLSAYIAKPLDQREAKEQLSLQDQMAEFMFLGLRLIQGVSFENFKASFGYDMKEVYGDVMEKHIHEGLLFIHKEKEEERISLTKEGLNVCNYVLADFLEPSI